MKLRWTRIAVEDLDHAYGYIARNNPGAARSMIDRIKAGINSLRSHPEIGRRGRVEGTGELIIPGTPFIVAYRIARERVEALAVVHGARRWPQGF